MEKREIDRTALCGMDGAFQLMHAHIANLEFSGKSVITPKYNLLVVDLHSSKVYVYPMRSRKQLLKYMNEFYVEIDKNEKELLICVCKQAANFNK